MSMKAMRRRQWASARVFEKAAAEGAQAVVVSAAIEAEIATLDPEERAGSSPTSALRKPASAGSSVPAMRWSA